MTKLIVDAVPAAVTDECRKYWMTMEYWQRITSVTIPANLSKCNDIDLDGIRVIIIFVNNLCNTPRLLNWNDDIDLPKVVVWFFECIFFPDMGIARDNDELNDYYWHTSNAIDKLMESKLSLSYILIKHLIRAVYVYLRTNAIVIGQRARFNNIFTEHMFESRFTGQEDVAQNFAVTCLKLLGLFE